ncbi:MAG TPA: hypothetical protein PLY93_06815 [Turneriella sp.]|nr:hypothetical protein [Turneriella sp.]
MPLMLYTVVFFFLLCIFGLFWFLQNSASNRNPYVSPFFPDHEKTVSTEDLSLIFGVKRIEYLSDRGRWFLFISIMLLIIEFFAVLGMLIENRGQMYWASSINHGYAIGGFVYLLVSIVAMVLSIRLVSAEKGLSIANPFERLEAWEQKILQADPEQKKRVFLYLSQESSRMEGYFSFTFALIACALTLLTIWIAGWLMQFVR